MKTPIENEIGYWSFRVHRSPCFLERKRPPPWRGQCRVQPRMLRVSFPEWDREGRACACSQTAAPAGRQPAALQCRSKLPPPKEIARWLVCWPFVFDSRSVSPSDGRPRLPTRLRSRPSPVKISLWLSSLVNIWRTATFVGKTIQERQLLKRDSLHCKLNAGSNIVVKLIGATKRERILPNSLLLSGTIPEWDSGTSNCCFHSSTFHHIRINDMLAWRLS